MMRESVKNKSAGGRFWPIVVEIALLAVMALALWSGPITARHHLLMAIVAVALIWCLVRPGNSQKWGRLVLALAVMFLFSLSLRARLPQSLDWQWTSLLVWIAVAAWILGSWRAGRLSLRDRWGYSASGLLVTGMVAVLMVILFLAFGERYMTDPELERHLGHQIAQYVALLLICLNFPEGTARVRRITMVAIAVLGLKLLLDWL